MNLHKEIKQVLKKIQIHLFGMNISYCMCYAKSFSFNLNFCNKLFNLLFSDLSPNTAEILFEIFEKGNAGSNPVFLGLGIVGVEELLISPSQRQLITLQSRPLQDDPVSGTLTVEVLTIPYENYINFNDTNIKLIFQFLFIEGADIPLTDGRPFKLKETLRTISPTTGQTTTTTRTVFKQHGNVSNF